MTRGPLTILCLASYFKGEEFLRECKRQGLRVFLLTLDSLASAEWPRESVDEFFYMTSLSQRDDITKAVSWLCREEAIDRIVPLDDFDVETAALLREHLRIPGMGDTTARHFRDKLAMRTKARERGILVPEFVHALNHQKIREFTERVPAPWVLKPRSEASAIGIHRIHGADELWPLLESLGDRVSFHLLEQYVAGDIYHIDGIVAEREVVFAVPHKYGKPPFDVAHEGHVFTSRGLDRRSDDARAIDALNRQLVATLGLVRGVTHTEFIKGREDGKFYFLESAARVGGANIAEMVEAATGINLWKEWARLEIAGEQRPYVLPDHRDDYAGIIISLARQEEPDVSAYDDAEIVWRLRKKNHAGLIVASPEPDRIEQLLEQYSRRFYEDFFARLPAPDRPTS